jgi:hypothetical protein
VEEPASAADYAWAAAQSAKQSADDNAAALRELHQKVAAMEQRETEYGDGTPRLSKKQLIRQLEALKGHVNANTAQVDECMKAISWLAEQVGELKKSRVGGPASEDVELPEEPA